jgi:hypothetical protein
MTGPHPTLSVSAAHIATVRNGLGAANTSLNWHSAEIIPTAEVPTYEDALRVARESIVPTRAALDALAARIDTLETALRWYDVYDSEAIPVRVVVGLPGEPLTVRMGAVARFALADAKEMGAAVCDPGVATVDELLAKETEA